MCVKKNIKYSKNSIGEFEIKIEHTDISPSYMTSNMSFFTIKKSQSCTEYRSALGDQTHSKPYIKYPHALTVFPLYTEKSYINSHALL